MSIFEEVLPTVEAAPPAETTGYKDKLDEPVGHKFAFVGCGAAGGRIVNEFYLKGYRRAMVVNTCKQDGDGLEKKLEYVDIGEGGSGKDPSVSRKLLSAQQNRLQMLSLYDEIIGREADYVFVCAGLGGGTGSGGGPVLAQHLQEHIRTKSPKTKVGCILAFPTKSEGSVVAQNALGSYGDFLKLKLSPIILLDNARVERIRKSSVANRYKDANRDVTTLLHTFNTLAAMPAEQTFDRADFAQLLNSGIVTFGMSGVASWKEGADTLSKAILETFRAATLAEVDVETATQGVCLIAAGDNVLNTFRSEELMGGLELLRNSSKSQSMMLHPGVYRIPQPEAADMLRVYVALGGLRLSEGPLKTLASVGNVEITSELAGFFGYQ